MAGCLLGFGGGWAPVKGPTLDLHVAVGMCIRSTFTVNGSDGRYGELGEVAGWAAQSQSSSSSRGDGWMGGWVRQCMHLNFLTPCRLAG